jgi:hypothetical protein
MAESSDLAAPLQMLAIKGSTTDATKDVTRDVITRKKYIWEEEEDGEKANSPISCKDLLRYIKKALYLDMKKIADKIVSLGAIIFGGYPRDSILKNYYNDMFYKFCQEYPNPIDIFKKEYNNKKCHPESYEGRNTLPKDIDCFVSKSVFNKIKEMLQANYYVKWKKDNVSVAYFKSIPDIYKDKLVHSSCIIRPNICTTISSILHLLSNFETVSLIKSSYVYEIDFIVYQDDNPVTFIDFITPGLDCVANSIYMLKDIDDAHHSDIVFKTVIKQKHFSSALINPINYLKLRMEDLEFVMKQIYCKETDIANYNIDTHRIDKLVNKGWKLSFKELIFKYKNHSDLNTYLENFIPNSDDECIICRANFKEGDEDITGIAVRNTKCECKIGYHLVCYATYHLQMTSHQEHFVNCAQCRRKISLYTEEMDILFTNIIYYNTIRKKYISTGSIL